MQLSQESRRVRWTLLLITWAIVAGLAVLHERAVADYMDRVDAFGMRGGQVPNTPLKRLTLSFASDAQTWVIHALTLAEGNSLRLRHTDIDNAPDGRDVHWNSAWAWSIVGAGRLRQYFTDEPLPTAIEKAVPWLNFTALMLLMGIFSWWVSKQAGAAAGVLVAMVFVGHSRFYEGFYPTYIDHHGLLTAAVLGLTLGVVFMGVGWWRASGGTTPASLLPTSREAARRGAIFSAVCGATGMWVSSASLVPPIALLGLTGLAVTLVRGRRLQTAGAAFDPSLWRLWGRIGAALSFGFYLLEYFPNHLGMRLEANHPFYSLAWLAGAELVAQASERWLASPAERWARPHRLILPLLAVAIVPVCILVGGAEVFVVRDPFHSKFSHYVYEGMNLFERLNISGPKEMVILLDSSNLPLVVGLFVLFLPRRPERTLLLFTFLATLVFTLMGLWQTRWLLNASGPQVALTLVLLATLSAGRGSLIAWGLTFVTIVGLYLPPSLNRVMDLRNFIRQRNVSGVDVRQALFRDVAAVFRASQPEGDIVVLSSPNSSTGIGYYGRFKTIGTLYWENNEGLKAAATIFSEHDPDKAAAMIRAHRITHVAMINIESFLPQYYAILHPEAPADEWEKSFGHQLLIRHKIPSWLQVIPYQIPPDLQPLGLSVLLFKVNFEQKPAEAYYNMGLGQYVWNDLAAAEKSFDEVIKLQPQSPEPWLRKAELLFARGERAASLNAFEKGIDLSPVANRKNLCNTTGALFYGKGAHAEAARMFRKGLQLSPDPELANNLAWLLSTSRDAAVRNGAEAQTLIQQPLRADPNSRAYLNTLAAVLAENGRYPEAAEVASRALTACQKAGDVNGIKQTEQRLAAYRSGKPWRE